MKIGYCDGATSNNKKGEGIGGYAWIILEDDKILNQNFNSLKNTTNNQCELTAIIELCNNIEKAIKVNEKVIIYSDSSYIINCYKQNWWIKWINNNWINSNKKPVANKQLWQQLIPFFKKTNFIFEKVAGHADNKWNNLVDSMAVSAKFD